MNFHVFTRSWASVCISYFFVLVETGAPPFLLAVCKDYLIYIGAWRLDVKCQRALGYNSDFRWEETNFDGAENAGVGPGARGVIAGACGGTRPCCSGDSRNART